MLLTIKTITAKCVREPSMCLHNYPLRQTIIIPVLQMEKQTQRYRNLLKVTPLTCGEAKIEKPGSLA